MNSTGERNALVDLTKRWPNNRVPYEFRSGVFSESEKNVIRQGMADYASETCVQMVERTTETDYVEFIKDGGCYSYWGRVGGKQPISLANGCVVKYIVIHEIMHAIGFLHEQSRYDRDQHVTINWDNICCNAARQFRAETSSSIDLLGLAYDLKSVMHYGERAFSSNGQKTIEAKNGVSPLGNSNGFTSLDIQKVNKLYECDGTPTTQPPTTQPSTTQPPTTQPPTTSATVATTTGAPVACEDTFGRMCQNMANKGRCKTRATMKFMHEQCPDSCGRCDSTCYDIYNQCRGFARRGWCENDNRSEWMETYCPFSCELCS